MATGTLYEYQISHFSLVAIAAHATTLFGSRTQTRYTPVYNEENSSPNQHEEPAMERRTDLQQRCAMAVAALSVELDWGLAVEAQRAYSAALPQYLAPHCSEQQLRMLALHYHQDHALVQALLRREHANHDAAWVAWLGKVMAILRHAGLAWSDDVSVDLEDLAQIARTELAHALPTFRYASRFSTWAHQVIVQSTQRHIRDRQALKRAGNPTSLDQAHLDQLPIRAADRPEAAAHARVLTTLINDILTAQPDPRLARIFQLWTQADMRAEQIGQYIHLSPSQVRVLLARTRELLQNDPGIQAWHASTFGDLPE